jgi:tRNA U55 pseudouridine synthase TruB
MPPKFSAVKINGKRSYELARNNLEFDMEEEKSFNKKY